MKWLFGLFLFAFAAYQVNSQACHMREIDLCLAIGIFNFQSNGIPSGEAQVDEWCESVQEVVQCMGNYTEKCLSPLQKEILQLLAGSGDTRREFCTAGSESRNKYLANAECLSTQYESDDFKDQMRDLQVVMEKMFDVTFKKRLTLMCCGFRRFDDKTEAIIGQKCGQPAVAMIRGAIKMVVTDLPNTICGRYVPENKECLEILPPTGTPSKGADNNTQLGKLLDTVFSNM